MMSAKKLLLIPALLPLLLLISCGSEQQSSQQQSYKDTKSMVLDVLKTEEAEKTIQQSVSKNQDKTTKLLSTGEGQQIQLAVKDLLTTQEQGVKILEKTMSDPKFAGDFAKAAQKNLKQIEKDLLKDPEYQKNLFEAFNNPDFQKIILETMKSQKYRQQMQDVVRESLQSPLFKAELISMFQKAVSEELKPKEGQSLSLTSQGGGKEGQDSKGGQDGGKGGQEGGKDGGKEDGKEGQKEGEQSGGEKGGQGQDSGDQASSDKGSDDHGQEDENKDKDKNK